MPTSRTLLREALAFLTDYPRLRVCDDDVGRADAALTTRIAAFLADDAASPPHPAIAVARARWAMVSFLRIDPGERCMEPDPDGIWVRAWIKVGMTATGDMPPETEERYERAVATLPSLTRRVFLAHHVTGLGYPDLARHFDISMAEVERRMTDALVAITRAMR